MPLDLSNTLVVGVATTALFDMTESDSAFQEKFKSDRQTAVAEYRAYALTHENEPLADGTGMPLVRALLALKGSTPILRTLSLRPILGRRSVHVQAQAFQS